MKTGREKGPEEDELDFLSNIIQVLNESYGLELNAEDKVAFERLQESLVSNEELMSYFNINNTKENIKDKFYAEINKFF